MKNKIIRLLIVLLALLLAFVFFLLISFAGDKSKGPMESLLDGMKSAWSSFEKRWISKDHVREKDLEWFNMFRDDSGVLRYPDTLIYGIYDNTYQQGMQRIAALEDSLQQRFPIIQIYSAWGSKSEQNFPLLETRAIYDLGSVPLITWEPWLNDFDHTKYPKLKNKENVNLGGMKLIASGYFDDYINNWIMKAKDFGQPFMLRFGHEMNDPYRYPWGPHNNNPEDFIAAWQHVYNMFWNAGLRNVIWVWSPHPAYKNYKNFYPGHEFVDWTGMTALNYGAVAAWSQWWSFNELINDCYDSLSLYNKPIIITEFGCLEVGGNRSDWYKQALTSIHKDYPWIKSVVFFHSSSDNSTTYKLLDWTFMHNSDAIENVRRNMFYPED